MPTVYVTAPRETGSHLARSLVEAEVAACVNLVTCESVYRWEDEVHEDREVILLVKVPTDGVEAVEEYVREEHPYDVPCIERFDEEWVLPAFAEWREAVTDETD